MDHFEISWSWENATHKIVQYLAVNKTDFRVVIDWHLFVRIIHAEFSFNTTFPPLRNTSGANGVIR